MKTSSWDSFEKNLKEYMKSLTPPTVVFPEKLFDEGVRRGLIIKRGKEYFWEGIPAYRDHKMPTSPPGTDLNKFKLKAGYRAKTD